MRKPDDSARKSQALRLLKEQKKGDANLVTLANKVVEGVHAFNKLKEKTLKSKGKKLVKRELDPKEGITISHEEIASSHPNKKAIDVFAHDRHGNQIGRATVEHSKYSHSKHAEVLDVEVKPEHRRKGVATAMYQHAEQVTGRELKPSKDRTESGTKFWQGTRGYGPHGHGPFGAHVQRIRKGESHPGGWISPKGEFHKAEDSQLHLEHYSSHDIEEVHPKFHGVGVPGEESKRKQDSDWVDRSYHYVAGTKPEAALGQKRYKYHSTVPKDKIYDMGKDPKGFTKNPTDEKGYRSHNVVERRIKDAGYLGYRHSGSAMPNVVAMFHPVKPHTKEDRQIEKVGLVGPRSNRKLGGKKGITGFSIISEENPKHEVTAKGPLEQHLKEAGYVYHKMKGKHQGKKENSYIVHNARSKHIEDLGRVYGQESVIHSTGSHHQMVYVNGPKAGQHHKGEGIQFHDKEPADNYSTLGSRHFSLNFDYEKLHKSEQVSQPGGSPIYDAGSARLHCETCQQKTYHTGHRQNQKERGTVWFHACAECGTEKPWIRKSEELEKTVMQGGQKEFHGWIDHEGTYHHMKPHEEHSDFEGASYDQGWLAVGIAGYANVQGKQKFVENPHHPATQTARKLVGEHFPDKDVDIHVMHEPGTKPGLNQTTHKVNGAHWAKHGTVPKSKVAEFHKAATMSVAVDFDGTIVENKFPEIGELKPGAIEALQALKSKGYKIIIHSARSSTPEGNANEMKAFLDKNQVPYDEIHSSAGKPIASAYIDDKSIEFKDNWQQIVDRVLMSGVKHRLEVLKSLVEKK